MNCKKCGNLMKETEIVCPVCGENNLQTNVNGVQMPQNNMGQPMNQYMNQPVMPNVNGFQQNDNNQPVKKNKNITIIAVAGIAVVILAVVILLFSNNNSDSNLENSNTNENTQNNVDSDTSDNSSKEESSSKPYNSTINKGEKIRIKGSEHLNIELKYISYDSTVYNADTNRNVLFLMEITNKSKTKKHNTSSDINIYDSSDNKLGGCTPYSSADRETAVFVPQIDSGKTMTVYYHCFIKSTVEPSNVAKAKYERTFLTSDFQNELVQYNLNLN